MSFGANGFSVKPSYGYGITDSFPRFGYYDQTLLILIRFLKYFHIIKLLWPETQEIVQIHK
jgi:hypothetical protein